MNRNGNTHLINEIYSKCLNQSQDISNSINEILNGLHSITTIDKVKQKIIEKLENYEESLRVLDRIFNELSTEDLALWKRYIFCLNIT